MSLQITYPFTTPGNYTYDADKIEVADGKAKLKLNDLPDQDFNEDFADDTGFTYDSDKSEFTDGKVQQKMVDNAGLEFNQPFDSDSGFTYDSDKAEFTGGLVKQKDKMPDGATCGANFGANINLQGWSGGVVTGTAVGGAAVSGNKLDLTGGGKYVDYNADLNADSQQVGCVRLKYTPNYNGTSPSYYPIFSILKANAVANNIIMLRHESGNVKVFIEDSSGSNIMSASLPSWTVVQGQTYEIELNWDLTTGATRLFIDGIQHGSTQTATGIRDSNISIFRLGGNYNGVQTNNCYIDDVLVFPTVQHTTDYTPDYSVPTYRYDSSKVELPAFSYSSLGDIQAFTNFVTTENNTPHYVINDKYYSGGWVVSDGSYAQSNTAAEVLANIATLPLSDTVNIDVVFNSNNSAAMDCGDLTLTYTGQKVEGSVVICPEMHYTGVGTLQAITNFVTTDQNSPRYTLQIGRSGDYLYWDGAQWSVSDGTYAQANNEATFLAHVADLDIEGEVYGQFKIIFDDSTSVQMNVSDLTVTVTGQTYPTDNPKIEVASTFSAEAILSAAETATKTGSDEIKYHAKVGSLYYWINDDTLEESDGTYAQANTASEWNEFFAEQTVPETPSICAWRALLHSADGLTTPELDQIILTYDYYGGSVTDPTTCILFGTEYDAEGNPVSGMTIKAVLNKRAEYNDEIGIGVTEISTTTDDDGYWDMDLIPNELLTPDDTTYEITFTKSGYRNRIFKDIEIPNQVSKNFYEL